MNNKGFQLSVNFLVVIIISLVLFGVGMALFTRVIGEGQDFQQDLDERTMSQLDALMDDGSLVVVPRRMVEVNRGEGGSIPVGFWNELGQENNFKVNVDTFGAGGLEIASFPTQYPLKNNERQHVLVGFNVPKNVAPGQYHIDIQVKQGGNDYGSKKRVYIVVN